MVGAGYLRRMASMLAAFTVLAVVVAATAIVKVFLVEEVVKVVGQEREITCWGFVGISYWLILDLIK